MDSSSIPAAAEIRQRLQPLRKSHLQRLADLSGVPFTTLIKIRSGETKNPGVDTVRAFVGFIPQALEQGTTQPAPLS